MANIGIVKEGELYPTETGKKPEALADGSCLNLSVLLQEYFPTEEAGINQALIETLLDGANIHLFGNTLLEHYDLERLRIIDFREYAAAFGNIFPIVVGRRGDSSHESLSALLKYPYDERLLREVASQMTRDIDLSVEGVELDQLMKSFHKFSVEKIRLDHSVTTPNMQLLRLNNSGTHAQISIINHNDILSYRTAPGLNLDIAHADVFVGPSNNLLAVLNGENRKLLGDPPTIRLIGSRKDLGLNQRRKDLVQSRALRHVLTIEVDGHYIEAAPGTRARDIISQQDADRLLRCARLKDPSVAHCRHELMAAALGYVKITFDSINY